MITYWNLCEHQWEELLWRYLEVDEHKGHLLTRGMPLGQMLESMAEAMADEQDAKMKAAIENAMDATKTCNANRNRLIHFQVSFGGNLIQGRSAKIDREFKVVDDDLKSIRRVAEDVKALHQCLWDIQWYLAQAQGGPVRNATLPKKPLEPRHLAVRPPRKSHPPRRSIS